MQDLHFKQADQCSLQPGKHEQFYRLFVNEKGTCLGSISIIMQGEFGLPFLAFYSVTKDKRTWMTTNYPLPVPLKIPPQIAMHAARLCETPEELLQMHQHFLALNKMTTQLEPIDDDPKALRDQLQSILETQLEYNLRQGILLPTFNDCEDVRYSWRGTFYVAKKYLQELVRLS